MLSKSIEKSEEQLVQKSAEQ